jgi:hypothetical protein
MSKYQDARLRSGFQICIQRRSKKEVRERLNAIPGVRVFDMLPRMWPVVSYNKNQTRFPYGKRVDVPYWFIVGKWEGNIAEIHRQLAEAKSELAMNGDLNALIPGFAVHLPNSGIYNPNKPAEAQLLEPDAYPDWAGPLDNFIV